MDNYRRSRKNRFVSGMDPDEQAKLAERIDFLRWAKADGSWTELARVAGVSRATLGNLVTRLKNGQSRGGTAQTLRGLEQGTGCSHDWLHDGVGNAFPAREAMDPFDRVMMERAWHPSVKDAMRGERSRGVTDTEVGWRRRFMRYQRAAEPTPAPPVSVVIAKKKA